MLLVGGLVVRSAAGRTHEDDVFAHALEQRHRFGKVCLVAADHDGKGGVACAAVAAGHRSVHHADALFLALLIQLLCQRGRGGGHVDGKCARFGAVEDAAPVAEHLFDVAGVADHHKDVVCILHRLGDGLAGDDAKLLLQFQQFFIAMGVGRYRVAVLCQMTGLLAAHDTGADPGNFFLPPDCGLICKRAVSLHKALPLRRCFGKLAVRTFALFCKRVVGADHVVRRVLHKAIALIKFLYRWIRLTVRQEKVCGQTRDAAQRRLCLCPEQQVGARDTAVAVDGSGDV